MRDLVGATADGPTESSKSFFVEYFESMQDEHSLYLLLEYLPGGELLKQIK